MPRLALGLFAAVCAAADLPWVASLGGRAETAPDGSVRALHLRRSWISDADLERIAALPSLERLDLGLTRITDLGLLRLRGLKNVRELDLFYAELITDEGLAAMRDWRKIERLNLRGTKVTDNTLALLAGKKSIQALDIGFAEVTDSGLQQLATLAGLRELAFGGNKLTEVGLQVLRGLPQLRVLDVSGRQRTDSGLWALTTTDVGMDPVSTITDLRELNVSGLGITGRGVEKLAALKNLERLDLHGCKRVGDDAVPHLAAMPALAWVDLQGTAITEKGFAELTRLRSALRAEGGRKSGPTAVTVDLENETVRVLRISLATREKAAIPSEPPAGAFDTYVTEGGFEGIHPTMRFGAMRLGPGESSKEIENLNDAPLLAIRVELLETELGKEQRFEPVPTEPGEAPKVVFENDALRVLRLACESRRPCPSTGSKAPALTVELGDASGKRGRAVWHAQGAPDFYNEFPQPLELVRFEFKR